MKKWFWQTAAAICVAAIAVSCANKDEKVDVDVKEDNLCKEVAEVMCHNIFECCTGEQIEEQFGVKITTSESKCRHDMRLLCEERNSPLLWAFERVTAELTTPNAQQCLESLVVPNDTCFPFVSSVPYDQSCNSNLIRGLQGAGTGCLFDFECAANLYCGADRKCRAYLTLGENCENGTCGSGLFCGPDETTYEMICQTLRAIGESCDYGSYCQSELYCDEDLEEPVCSAKKSIGESCDSDWVCETGNCLPGVCENDPTETCLSSEDCGGYCEDSGDECFGPSDCGSGYCLEGGEYCTDDSDCSGNYCEESTSVYCTDDTMCPGTCFESDTLCDDDGDCDAVVSGDTCDFQTCLVNSCEGADQCITGACIGDPKCAENYFTFDWCQVDPMSMFGGGMSTGDDWEE
jgi:hypothetical protein